MKRVHRVVKRRRSAAKTPRQARHLDAAQFDQRDLATRTYLTVDQAMAYLGGFPSENAFRLWVRRRGIPKCRANGLRFLRRDIDQSVQPYGQLNASHVEHGTSAESEKKGGAWSR